MDNIVNLFKETVKNLSDEDRAKINEELKELFAEPKNPASADTQEKKRVWRPNINEKYYFVDNNGRPNSYCWEKTVSSIALSRFNAGNCYQTKKECELELAKRKLYREIELYLDEIGDSGPRTGGVWVTIEFNGERVYPSVCSDYQPYCKQFAKFPVWTAYTGVSNQVIEKFGDRILKLYVRGEID